MKSALEGIRSCKDMWSALTVNLCFFSGGGTVDFQEFVAGLSAFSNQGSREEKLKCELHEDFG